MEKRINTTNYEGNMIDDINSELHELKANERLWITDSLKDGIEISFIKDEFYYPGATETDYPEIWDEPFDPEIDYKSYYNNVQIDVYVNGKCVATSYDEHCSELDVGAVLDGTYSNFVEDNRSLYEIVNAESKEKSKDSYQR